MKLRVKVMENNPDNIYLDYITSEHNTKNKFVQTVDISTHPYVTLQGALRAIAASFDIDTAVGSQLDAVGLWVGQDRNLTVALRGVYFSYNTIPSEGWDSGVWKQTFDPTDTIKVLDDDSYRYLLKLKIVANSWNGSRNQAYDIWEATFGDDTFILVTDYQNMSVELGFSGEMPAPVRALLQAGLNPFKPESVRVKTYLISNTDGPMFGWDIANEAINGWDTAYWADEIIPQENFY